MQKRIDSVRERFGELGIDGLLVLIEENRRYLSGFTGEDNGTAESAGALFIGKNHLFLLTDGRYTTQAAKESSLFHVARYQKGLESVLAEHMRQAGVRCLGIEASRVTLSQHEKMEKALAAADDNLSLKPVGDIIGDVREIKDDTEIDWTRKALSIAEKAFQKTLGSLTAGMTEREVAWALEKNMREGGAESLAFPVIVASGPNAALPHAVPGDRRIQEGEPIIIDWGARLGGYCSDTTRTIVLGQPDDLFQKVFATVKAAHRKACAAIRLGASGTEIDRIARNWIDNHGFQDRFQHSLGHGTGLAVHEKPGLGPVKDSTLKSGMIVTVEPGIYIPDWGGVRLENQVVVRSASPEILNELALDISLETRC